MHMNSPAPVFREQAKQWKTRQSNRLFRLRNKESVADQIQKFGALPALAADAGDQNYPGNDRRYWPRGNAYERPRILRGATELSPDCLYLPPGAAPSSRFVPGPTLPWPARNYNQ